MTGDERVPRRAIDLNSDLGESADSVRSGLEASILDWVSSANVACGGHAGDRFTMTETIRAALSRKVAVGAHPGYPDRARFGRFELAMTPSEIEAEVAEQIARLGEIAGSLGAELRHVKPHGALYHAAMTRREAATAVARAAAGWSREIVLVGQAGSPALTVWRDLGLRAVAEAFADRRYEPDGSLRARSRDGALLVEPSDAASQAVRIASGDGVIASDGSVLVIEAGSICVHGDTPGAVAIARAVREALEGAGFQVEAP